MDTARFDRLMIALTCLAGLGLGFCGVLAFGMASLALLIVTVVIMLLFCFLLAITMQRYDGPAPILLGILSLQVLPVAGAFLGYYTGKALWH